MTNLQSYRAIDVAKYIVMYCTQRGVMVSNIKLQKILYFVYGMFLVQTNQSLFGDEFRAWQYGPVIESVYNEFSIYGGSYICLSEPGDSVLSDDIKSIIDPVIEDKMHQDVFDLVNETHLPGSAWYRAIEKGGGVSNRPLLCVEDIRQEFMNKDVSE